MDERMRGWMQVGLVVDWSARLDGGATSGVRAVVESLGLIDGEGIGPREAG